MVIFFCIEFQFNIAQNCQTADLRPCLGEELGGNLPLRSQKHSEVQRREKAVLRFHRSQPRFINCMRTNHFSEVMKSMKVFPEPSCSVRHCSSLADEKGPIAALCQQQLSSRLIQGSSPWSFGSGKSTCELHHVAFGLMLVTIQPLRSLVEPHLMTSLLAPRRGSGF